MKFGIALPSSTLFDILDQSRFSTDAFERELLYGATCPIALVSDAQELNHVDRKGLVFGSLVVRLRHYH